MINKTFCTDIFVKLLTDIDTLCDTFCLILLAESVGEIVVLKTIIYGIWGLRVL